MKRLIGLIIPFALTACMPLLAAGQSRHFASAPVSIGAWQSLSDKSHVTVRLVSVPGGGPVIGGESGNGTLDLGNVSYFSSSYAMAGKSRNSTVRTTEFGIELQAASASTMGAAMVSAYLAEPTPGCTYLIDGIRLTTTPQVISARVSYGVISKHRLEIRVPATTPPGLKRASIIWIATPEE
jgi:hypothetical protein